MKAGVIGCVLVVAIWAWWSPDASAQSVVNWGAVTDGTVPPSSAPSPVPHEKVTPLVTPPIPPPLPAQQPVQQVPLPDVSTLSSGYTQGDGEEPSLPLDAGTVSPELMARYAQQPGESQSSYIERMGRLYRQSQAQLEATQRRNETYLRSLAPPPRPSVPPSG